MSEIKFKDLTIDNLFDAVSVINSIGLEEFLNVLNLSEIAKSGKSTRQIGMAVAMKVSTILVKKLPEAKDEIYTFFANCTEWDNGSAVTINDLKGMKLAPFIRLVKDFAKKDDLTDFFGELAGLVGMEPSKKSATDDTQIRQDS